jgi:hypothetical protein
MAAMAEKALHMALLVVHATRVFRKTVRTMVLNSCVRCHDVLPLLVALNGAYSREQPVHFTSSISPGRQVLPNHGSSGR